MKMKKKIQKLAFFTLLLCPFFTSGQIEQFSSLSTAKNDTDRATAHQALNDFVVQSLNDALTTDDLEPLISNWPAGNITAGSGIEKVVILSWNSERFDRTQDYGCFVIFGFEKVGGISTFKWTELTHNRKEDPTNVERSYRADDWPGAIYYKLILTHVKKSPVYTLLGWEGADGQVTRKIIETMIITNDRIRLGVPYLKTEEGLKKRHVLEYGDALQATLNYEADQGRIVLDRLAPSDPSLLGATAFYGPTMEYDAFVWEGEKWVFTKDVNVSNKNESNKRNKIYNDPRPNTSKRSN
tara:strand:+ start:1782 stop:2672 length:891 start_codon:yes stop_codon:yes gene_type:complete